MTIKCPKCNHENPDDTFYCGKCTTPLKSSEDIDVTATIEAPKEELNTGSTFAGRYQIIEEIGKGGMGRVYKVHDTKVQEKIALKLIKPEIAKDKKTIERFSNELRLARKIRHKNVCQMFDLGEERGTQYITMEYVSGEDLRNSIRRFGQLPIGKSIAIVNQICEGLAEAHRQGVVHRDLKSNNIMIDDDGNVRIMDFGIARSLEAKGITGAGVMIGTPEYMSPEQVEGKETDQRSDIYSLGVILYEMVTGKLPFEGDTPFTVGVKQKSEVPQNPKSINSQIPDDLNKVILRCLEKERESRFQSVGEIRSELSNIEKGIPTTERIIPDKKPLTSKEITVTIGLKKIIKPILVIIALTIIAVVIWQILPQKEEVPPLSSEISLAVLPFDDLSPGKDHEYLCDGISVTLINALNEIKDLHIPAKTSSFSFKDQNLTVQEIGQKLNVGTVLEGTVQVDGDRLRITAWLSNVDDGYQLWSESYDKNFEEVFSVQDDIAQKIADALKIELLREKKTQIITHYTYDPAAYELYTRGYFFLDKRGKSNIEMAVECFDKAIEKDSNYALAHLGLAESYVNLGDWGILPSVEAYPKAREAANRALEIDDSLSEAYCVLAMIKYAFDWDWEKAEELFELSISLKPNYSVAHKEYGLYLTKLKRFDEARKELRKAQELDPVSLAILSQATWPLRYSGKYNEAIKELKQVLQMDPDFDPAQNYLSQCYFWSGMFDEALELYQKRGSEHGLARCYAKMGRIEEAKEIINRLSSSQNVNFRNHAGFYFMIGENDQGYYWLERGFETRDYSLTFLKIYEAFDNLRSDPRFKEMMKKVGLDK